MSRRFGSRELLHPSFANAPKPNKSSPPEVNHINRNPIQDTQKMTQCRSNSWPYPLVTNHTSIRGAVYTYGRHTNATGGKLLLLSAYRRRLEWHNRQVFGARAMGRGYCCYISASSPKYLVDVLFGLWVEDKAITAGENHLRVARVTPVLWPFRGTIGGATGFAGATWKRACRVLNWSHLEVHLMFTKWWKWRRRLGASHSRRGVEERGINLRMDASGL